MEFSITNVNNYLQHGAVRLGKRLRNFKLKFTSCDLCDGPCQQYSLLCQHCHMDLPLFSYQQIQGNLLNWPAINKGLPGHEFERLICVAPYLWPFDQWLTQLKYQGRFELSGLCAELMAECWHSLQSTVPRPDAILSVPIHGKRWQERGFNQSHLIAQKLAKAISTPYQASRLIRHKDTSRQVGQTGSQRRKNLRQAFGINNHKELPEHILLIDDVVTTGTTANEICKLLKQNGVKTVTLMAVCLTLP